MSKQRDIKRVCPSCKRKVTIRSDGRFVTHGPGVDDFYCSGSGMVAPERSIRKYHKRGDK